MRPYVARGTMSRQVGRRSLRGGGDRALGGPMG
jgi:hypothetical protein